MLPTALLLGVNWPPRRDWPAVAPLGLCFFGLFFVFYNIAIGFTTAARASLALATLPLRPWWSALARRRAADQRRQPASVSPCSASSPHSLPACRRRRRAHGAAN